MKDQKARLHKCPVCDTVVEVLDEVGMELVCCGPPMIPLEPRTDQAEAAMHRPVVRQTVEGLAVTVGHNLHPMEDEHRIEWIEVNFEDKCLRQFLRPGQSSKVFFALEPRDRTVAVRCYCNVHGLWETQQRIAPRSFRFGAARQVRPADKNRSDIGPIISRCQDGAGQYAGA